MARPIKNNLDYFPHDNKMRNDRKIKALRAKYGLEGYAVYNMLLEILCEAELLIIRWDETEIELISGDLTIVSDKLTEITEYLCKIKLMNRVNGWLFCTQLDKRSEAVFGKRTRELDSLRNDNGIDVTETPVSAPESTQSKAKKRKVKESIPDGKPSTDFIQQIIILFQQIYLDLRNIEYVVSNKDKERSAVGKLLKLYKDKNPDVSSEQTLEDMGKYFKACITIDDNWLHENMSLPIIINQFNKINNILRHGKKGKSGADWQKVAGFVAREFGN